MTIHALLSLLIASPAPAGTPYVPDVGTLRATMKSLEPEYKTTKELLLMQNEKRAAFAFKKLAAFCTSLKRMEARLKADGYNHASSAFDSCRRKIKILATEIDPLLLDLAYLRSQQNSK